MGLFDRFTEKQYCVVCGSELGKLFGRTKLADGIICKNCAGKLSPYFNRARQSTTEQIKEQLAYREQNKAAVQGFHLTRTIGEAGTRVYLDEDAGKAIITSHRNWREANPDVLDYTQITGCNLDIKESKTEITRTDREGKEVSYNPPRYDIDYDFYVTLFVDSPYFSEIRFKVNQNRIDKRGSMEYRQAEETAEEIRKAFSEVREEVRAAAAPKAAVQCPHCLATTYPDANGRCEFCGGALAG